MTSSKFCSNCGTSIDVNSNCGAKQGYQNNSNQINQVYEAKVIDPNFSDKDKTTCLILCILSFAVQIHGIHRFYTGHIGIGIFQLLTLGGCGIWTIIDLIHIASDNFTDSDGKPLKKS